MRPHSPPFPAAAASTLIHLALFCHDRSSPTVEDVETPVRRNMLDDVKLIEMNCLKHYRVLSIFARFCDPRRQQVDKRIGKPFQRRTIW